MTDAASADYEFKIMPELSEEHIANAMATFGMDREEVIAHWEDTQRLAREGGVQAVMDDLGQRITGEYEPVVDEMVESAVPMLAETPDGRNQAIAEYHHYATSELDQDKLDPDILMTSLTLATYKMAELQAKIAQLQDGHHRK